MNVVALCAGIGGLELGIKLAEPDARVVCYVESDPFAACVLAARMAEGACDPAPLWDDLRTFDGRPWRGVVDCIAAGFPCQDLSAAGKRAGILGTQSGVWSHVARVIGEVGPRFVFLENSPRAVRCIDAILGPLAQLGYCATWDCVSASSVGAKHIRRRFFLLAWRDMESRDVPDTERCEIRDKSKRGDGFSQACNARDAELVDVGGELVPILPRNRRGVRPDGVGLFGNLPGVPEPFDWDGWESFVDSGGPQPGVRRAVDGPAGWMDRARADRLRCLGNAVVPQQAALAWRILRARLKTHD